MHISEAINCPIVTPAQLSGIASSYTSTSPLPAEKTTRTSAPRLFTENRSSELPGTRSMSPKEQKVTPGRAAMARAWSMSATGVTHTGQPGP